jgi:hypothetical protein
MLLLTMTNTTKLFTCFLSALLLLLSCKKEKATTIHIEGRLLFSNTNPLPVTSYSMEIVQAPNIPLMNPSSISTTTNVKTDNQGYFKCDFKDNSNHGYFNGSLTPIHLRGDGTPFLPWFTINDIVPGNMGDIYLYKKIDSAILSVDASFPISPTDTLQINYYSINGLVTKKKTGVKVTAGTTNNLIDTLYNVCLITLEYQPKIYRNDILITQTNYTPTTGQPHTQAFMGSQDPNTFIGPGDEKKHILKLR